MNKTRAKLGAVCLALAALAGCGQQSDTSTDSSVSPWLYGLGGFALGQLTARHTTPPAPAPQVVIARPVVVANAAAVTAAVTAAQVAQHPHPRPAEPPAKVAPPPTPTPVPKSPPAPAVAPARPTYSGPTGYSSIRQSAPTFSGGARR